MNRVRFLQYLSRPRMLLIFEIDSVVVAFVIFSFLYYVLSSSGMNILLVFLFSFSITYVGIREYTKVKENTTKGFIYHFFYVHGLNSVKEDPEKYKEVKYKDITQIVPDGNADRFTD